jgi:outer membrane protein W
MVTTAEAQVQVMPAVNVIVADGDAFGVGSISGRYFVSSRIATGINVRYIPTTRLILTTLEVDYFFNPAKSIRPFIGLEGGSFNEFRTRSVYIVWGIAPKVGVQARLSPLIGIQVDVSHPIAIRRGERFGGDSGFLIGSGLNFSLGSVR